MTKRQPVIVYQQQRNEELVAAIKKDAKWLRKAAKDIDAATTMTNKIEPIADNLHKAVLAAKNIVGYEEE